LAWVDGVLREFAGWSCAKTSPVQLFWHSFDLAVTRFSGHRAPPLTGVDGVTAEAYSHEVISFGFWPGDETTPLAAFYSYTAPEPDTLTDHELSEGAQWVDTGNGHMARLPYADIRSAPDPRTSLLRFLQSAYEAGTDAAGWPAAEFAIHRE